MYDTLPSPRTYWPKCVQTTIYPQKRYQSSSISPGNVMVFNFTFPAIISSSQSGMNYLLLCPWYCKGPCAAVLLTIRCAACSLFITFKSGHLICSLINTDIKQLIFHIKELHTHLMKS